MSSRGESTKNRESVTFRRHNPDSLNKFKNIVNKDINNRNKEIDKTTENPDTDVLKEMTEILESKEVKIKSINFMPKKIKPVFVSSSASSSNGFITMQNALLQHEIAEQQNLMLSKQIEEINIHFYTKYLACKKKKKIEASFEAMIDNIMFVAGSGVLLSGTFYLTATYALPHLLQTLALQAASGSVKNKLYDSLMSETTLKFASELFFGLTPQQSAALSTKLAALRGSMKSLMQVDEFRKNPGNIMALAFNGKNPINMLPGSALKATDLIDGLRKRDEAGAVNYETKIEIPLDLRAFQKAVLDVTNFMIERAAGPIFSHPFKTDAAAILNPKKKIADLSAIAKSLSDSAKTDPTSATSAWLLSNLGVKGVSQDAIAKLLTAASSVKKMNDTRKKVLNFYRDQKLGFDNIYALFTPPKTARAAPKAGFFESVVNRTKNSAVLRDAFTKNLMKSFGFEMSGGSSGKTSFPINSVVLFFKDKLTPSNFLGYTTGAFYDSLTNKVSTGIKSLYPTAFAENMVRPLEDEEELGKKAKEQEAYDEGIRRIRIAYIQEGKKGDQLTRLMKEAEIMNNPNPIINAEDYQALEYVYLNIKVKTKQLMEKGILFEPFFLWGTTSSIQLFSILLSSVGRPDSNSSVFFPDYYHFLAQPMLDTFSGIYSSSADSAFAKLANELNTKISQIYNDTYDNYIKKPLMNTDLVKYLNENARNKISGAGKSALSRIYLGVYISKVYNQIVDLFFDTLINMPINFPNRVVTDYQNKLYSTWGVYNYLTPNGWRFLTDNCSGKDVAELFKGVGKHVMKNGLMGLGQALAESSTYVDDEVYPDSVILSKRGFSSISGMINGEQLSELYKQKQKEKAFRGEEKAQKLELSIAEHLRHKPLETDIRAFLEWKLKAEWLSGQHTLAAGLPTPKSYFGNAIDYTRATASTYWNNAKDYATQVVAPTVLGAVYDLTENYIGERSHVSGVMIKTGYGTSVQLTDSQSEQFLSVRQHSDLTIGAAENYIREWQGNNGLLLDEAYLRKYASENNIAYDKIKGDVLRETIANVNKIGGSECAPGQLCVPTLGITDYGVMGWWKGKDKVGDMHEIGLGLRREADRLNRISFVKTVAPTTKTAFIDGILYRVSVDETKKSDSNPLGIVLFEELYKGGSIDASFDNTFLLRKAISMEMLGADGKNDEILDGQFIDIRVPNHSPFGPRFYNKKITAEEYAKRNAADLTAFKLAVGAGVDTSGDFSSNPIYIGLKYEEEHNSDFRQNLALRQSSLDGRMVVNKVISETIKLWRTGEEPVIGELASEKAAREKRNIDNIKRADRAEATERKWAAGSAGLVVDEDLVELYTSRDSFTQQAAESYQMIMNSLPPGLRSSMKANNKKVLGGLRSTLLENQNELNRLVVALEKSNGINCSVLNEDDKRLFEEASASVPGADLGILKNGCPDGKDALLSLKTQVNNLDTIIKRINKGVSDEALDISDILNASSSYKDIRRIRQTVEALIENKAEYNGFLEMGSDGSSKFKKSLEEICEKAALALASLAKERETKIRAQVNSAKALLDSEYAAERKIGTTVIQDSEANRLSKALDVFLESNVLRLPKESSMDFFTRMQKVNADVSKSQDAVDSILPSIRQFLAGFRLGETGKARLLEFQAPEIGGLTVVDGFFSNFREKAQLLQVEVAKDNAVRSEIRRLQELIKTLKPDEYDNEINNLLIQIKVMDSGLQQKLADFKVDYEKEVDRASSELKRRVLIQRSEMQPLLDSHSELLAELEVVKNAITGLNSAGGGLLNLDSLNAMKSKLETQISRIEFTNASFYKMEHTIKNREFAFILTNLEANGDFIKEGALFNGGKQKRSIELEKINRGIDYVIRGKYMAAHANLVIQSEARLRSTKAAAETEYRRLCEKYCLQAPEGAIPTKFNTTNVEAIATLTELQAIMNKSYLAPEITLNTANWADALDDIERWNREASRLLMGGMSVEEVLNTSTIERANREANDVELRSGAEKLERIKDSRATVDALFSKYDQQMGQLLGHAAAYKNQEFIALSSKIEGLRTEYVNSVFSSNYELSLMNVLGELKSLSADGDVLSDAAIIIANLKEAEQRVLVQGIEENRVLVSRSARIARDNADLAGEALKRAALVNSAFNPLIEGQWQVGNRRIFKQYEEALRNADEAERVAKKAEKTALEFPSDFASSVQLREVQKQLAATSETLKTDAETAAAYAESAYRTFRSTANEKLLDGKALIAQIEIIERLNGVNLDESQQRLHDTWLGEDSTKLQKLKTTLASLETYLVGGLEVVIPIPIELTESGGILDSILAESESLLPPDLEELQVFKEFLPIVIEKNREEIQRVLAQGENLALLEKLRASLKLLESAMLKIQNKEALSYEQIVTLRLAYGAEAEEGKKRERGSYDIYKSTFDTLGARGVLRLKKYHSSDNSVNTFSIDFNKTTITRMEAENLFRVEYAIDMYMEENSKLFSGGKNDEFRTEMRKCLGDQQMLECPTTKISNEVFTKIKAEMANRDSQLNMEVKYLLDELWGPGLKDKELRIDSGNYSDGSINDLLSKIIGRAHEAPPSLLAAGLSKGTSGLQMALQVGAAFVNGVSTFASRDLVQSLYSNFFKGALKLSQQCNMNNIVLRSRTIGNGVSKIAAYANTLSNSFGPVGGMMRFAALGAVLGGVIGGYVYPGEWKGALMGAVGGGLAGAALFGAVMMSPLGPAFAVGTALYSSAMLAATGVNWAVWAGVKLANGKLDEYKHEQLIPFLPIDKKTGQRFTSGDADIWSAEDHPGEQNPWSAAVDDATKRLGKVADFSDWVQDPGVAANNVQNNSKAAFETEKAAIHTRLTEAVKKGGIDTSKFPSGWMSDKNVDWWKDLSQIEGDKIMAALFPVHTGFAEGQRGGGSLGKDSGFPAHLYFDKLFSYIYCAKFPLYFRGYSKKDIEVMVILDYYKYVKSLCDSLNKVADDSIIHLEAYVYFPFYDVDDNDAERIIDFMTDIDSYEETGSSIRPAFIADEDFVSVPSLAPVNQVPVPLSLNQVPVAKTQLMEKKETLSKEEIKKLFTLHYKKADEAFRSENKFDIKTLINAKFRKLTYEALYDVCGEMNSSVDGWCRESSVLEQKNDVEYSKLQNSYNRIVRATDAEIALLKNVSTPSELQANKAGLLSKVENMRVDKDRLMEPIDSKSWLSDFEDKVKFVLEKQRPRWSLVGYWGEYPSDEVNEILNEVFDTMKIPQNGGNLVFKNRVNSRKKRYSK